MIERTLVILKPDALSKNIGPEIIRRLEAAGATLKSIKVAQLTPDILQEHYAHVKDRDFYPEMEHFMTSRAVSILVFLW